MERLDKLEYELSGLSNAVSQIAQVLQLRNQVIFSCSIKYSMKY